MPDTTFRQVTGEGPKGLWTPKQKQLITGNYVRAYMNAPESMRKLGSEFYPNWHEDAQHIADVIGQSHEAGSALIAHLSPSNEAEKNRIQAIQLVHGVSDKASAMLIKASEHAAAAKSAGSTAIHARKSGDTERASRFGEIHAKETAENNRLRQKSGIKGTPLGMLGSREIAKALLVREGSYQGNPMDTLGAVKLGDFGGLIHDPHGYPRVPVDTHLHDAGVNRIDIPYQGAERGLNSKGRYENFQSAHEHARQTVMRQTGVEIEPGAMMGGIWYAHQQRKVLGNPDAMSARKAVETQINNWRSSNLSSQFMPENYGLKPSFGKIAMSR